MKPYYQDEFVTLYHGDCLEIMASIPDLSVDLTLTDPPYNCVNRPSGGLRTLDKGSADDLPVSIPDTWAQIDRLTRHSAYVFCGDAQVGDWFEQTGNLTRRLCTWHKPNPSPMNGDKLWLSASEFCVYARKPKAYWSLSCAHNVWDHPVDRDISWHPTPKPVPLLRYLIEASCPPGGVVLDCFAGSGATLRAAVDCGRRAIGIEVDQQYCDRIVSRLAQGVLDFSGAA